MVSKPHRYMSCTHAYSFIIVLDEYIYIYIYIYIDNVNNEGFSWSVKTNQQVTNNKKIHKWFEKSNSSHRNKSKLFPFFSQILPISVGCLWVGENFTVQFIFISFICLFLSRYFQCTWVGSIFRHTLAKLFARKYSKYSESYRSVNHSLKTKKDKVKVTSESYSMSCYWF